MVKARPHTEGVANIPHVGTGGASGPSNLVTVLACCRRLRARSETLSLFFHIHFLLVVLALHG